jgi:glycosyltransferase involved in cell wall biosynthesis
MHKKGFWSNLFSNRKTWFLGFFVFSFLMGILVSYLAIAKDWHRLTLADLLIMVQLWITHYPFALGTIFLFITIVTMGALRYVILLQTSKTRVRFSDGLTYAILARYYVLVTPFGLGGQPFMMAVMRDKNIPIGQATSAPTLDVFSMRLAMFTISFIFLWFVPSFGQDWIIWVAWVGFFFSSFSPVVLISLSFFPFFEQWIIKVAGFFSPTNKKKKTIETIKKWVQKYQVAIKVLIQTPWKMILVYLTSIISQLAMLSFPFFLLSSVSSDLIPEQTVTYWDIFLKALVGVNATSWIPTLGNAGAAEFSFAAIFGNYAQGFLLFWTIFAWRLFSFYLPLLLGLWTTLQQSLNRKRELRFVHRPNFNLPLRVYLFVDNFFPNTDGVVRAVDGYARYLLTQGIQVCVVAPQSMKVYSQYPYETIFLPSLKILSFPYPLAVFPLSESLKDRIFYEGPAIYHVHSPFFVGEKAMKLARAHHVPLVATFHSKYEEDIKAIVPIPGLVTFFRNYFMRVFQRAQSIFTVSNSTIKTLKEYGIQQPVTVFNNGTNFEKIEVTSMEMDLFKSSLQLQNTQTLLFVGQLIWHKNIRLIIDACLVLKKRKVSFKLLFVGNGRDEKAIKHYVKKVGLSSDIVFVGRVSDIQTLSKFYQLASVLLLPSRYDNDPLVIKEAAVHHLPSIVPINSYAAEKIKHQVNGYLCELNVTKLADLIKEILSDHASLITVGKNAHKTLAHPWSDTLKHLLEAYQKNLSDYYEEE